MRPRDGTATPLAPAHSRRAAIVQRGEAASLEASYPAMTALARHPHRFGDVGDGPALDDDSLHEQSSAVERETGVTVSHEDLRFVKTAISTMPGGLLTSADRHQRHGRVQLVTCRGDYLLMRNLNLPAPHLRVCALPDRVAAPRGRPRPPAVCRQPAAARDRHHGVPGRRQTARLARVARVYDVAAAGTGRAAAA